MKNEVKLIIEGRAGYSEEVFRKLLSGRVGLLILFMHVRLALLEPLASNVTVLCRRQQGQWVCNQ